jgi:hypothetical protein
VAIRLVEDLGLDLADRRPELDDPVLAASAHRAGTLRSVDLEDARGGARGRPAARFGHPEANGRQRSGHERTSRVPVGTPTCHANADPYRKS